MSSSESNTSGATPNVTARVLQQTRVTAELLSSQFTSLLAAIQQSETRLDQKLSEFKTEMKGAQEEAAAKAASRVRLEKPYEYKRKAHEEQATFNTKIQEAVKEHC